MSKIPEIIDNRKFLLKDTINDIVKCATSGKIAAGYFYLNGFDLIKDNLNPNCKIDIIIGEETDTNTASEISKGYQLKNEENTIQNIINSTQNLDDKQKEKIYYLSEYIKEEKINFRIYTKDKFHSKSYIFDVEYNNGDIEEHYAIIGSSNFSKRGLGEKGKYGCNTELNATIRQHSAIEEVKKWFDEIWEESEDFNEELLKIIKNNIKSVKLEYSPMDILLKSLYHLYNNSKLFDNNLDLNNLTEFQIVGVNKAISILDKYDGVIISDSVGLGKTFMGMGLLRYYHKLNHKLLIICPASLYVMWSMECKTYNLDIKVVTQEEIARNGLDTNFMKDVKYILIDEAHNFRNDSSERFKELVEFTSNKKIIELTATPINNSVMDLYNIMNLFLKNDEFKDKFGVKDLKEAMRDYENNKDIVNNIISEVMIRRSRSFIKSKYFSGVNSKMNKINFKFPKRKIYTVNYSLSAIYGDDIFNYIISKLEDLNLPIISKDKITDEKVYLTKGLIKIMFLKRLESSIEAFKESIKRQNEYCKTMLEFIKEGFLFYKKDILNLQRCDIDEKLKIDINEYHGDINKLVCELKEDYKMFDDILNILNNEDIIRDNKIKTLINILNTEIRNKKILIFTQYKDTARYIYKVLKDNIEDVNIEEIDGSKKQDKQDIIQRFAPKANDFKIDDNKEIDILISTDILSEGQNLQDSNIIINYDLPWNPVRIIQREGRIDRITTEHDYIYLYNFMPDKDLDKLLNLVDKIKNKIKNINSTIGNESKIISEDEQITDKVFNDENSTVNIRKMIESENIEQYFLELENSLENELPNEEYMQDAYKKLILENEANKIRIENLSDGIFTTRICEKYKGIFMYYKSNNKDYWLFYNTCTDEWIENKESIYTIISYGNNLELKPIVKKMTIDVEEILSKGKLKVIENEEKLKQYELAPSKVSKNQKDIIRRLNIILSLETIKSGMRREEKDLIKTNQLISKEMVKKLKYRLPRGIEKQINNIKDIENIEDRELLKNLSIILNNINQSHRDEIEQINVKLICYEVLI